MILCSWKGVRPASCRDSIREDGWPEISSIVQNNATKALSRTTAEQVTTMPVGCIARWRYTDRYRARMTGKQNTCHRVQNPCHLVTFDGFSKGFVYRLCRIDHVSLRRGINMTRLQGRVRLSSCSTIRLFQASLHAPDEPGSTKIKVELATPARARDCKVEVLIS